MICLWMGKTNTVETPSSDFKVITPEIPLLSQQEITSKRIPVAYINLQLNPYPNTQLDLFYSDNFSFWCTAPSIWLTNCADPSTRLNHQLEKVVGCKVLQFIPVVKIQKMLDHKILWCTNTTTSSQERWTKANSISDHNLLKHILLNTCATCEHFDDP